MDYLKKYQQRLESKISNLENLLDKKVYDRESEIAAKIRARWKLGEKPDGSAIGVYKSREYAEQKHEQNPEAGLGFVDLTLTGSTGRKLKISKYGEDYEIYSQDEKYLKVAAKYGDENFNLRDSEAIALKEDVENELLMDVLSETYK